MTQVERFTFHTPIFRVNNRQDNIDFYQGTLGFKLLTEENALAVFTAWQDQSSLFVIEESPRSRAVNGLKKTQLTVIKLSDPKEIDYLLARDDHQAKTIYQGDKGYAFETLSPENDRFLVHAEDDLDSLKTVEYADVDDNPDFKGVSDFTVQSLTLNVPDVVQAAHFYDCLFGEDLPLSLHFQKAQGPDLEASPDATWDLEILEFKVAQDYDLAALQAKLEKEHLASYLDSKGNLMALNDMSNIEVWLTK